MGARPAQGSSAELFTKQVILGINKTPMHTKVTPNKPFLMLLYGYPGSGKTTFAQQFTDDVHCVHLHADRLFSELQDQTGMGDGKVANYTLEYIAKELLRSGISVVLDVSVIRKSIRSKLREAAKQSKASPVLVWLQIDPESAYTRTQSRDRRRSEDKYAHDYDVHGFETELNNSQNPENEDYVVISGKHTYHTQSRAVIKKLYNLGILTPEQASSNIAKPELVNLVPKQFGPGRVDMSRRNISIR